MRVLEVISVTSSILIFGALGATIGAAVGQRIPVEGTLMIALFKQDRNRLLCGATLGAIMMLLGLLLWRGTGFTIASVFEALAKDLARDMTEEAS